MTATHRTVYGAFTDREHAQHALDDLRTHGFGREDMSFVDSARDEDVNLVRRMDTRSEEGTGYGIAAGGTIGAILGALAGLGAGIIAIPGLGGLLVAGWLLAALSGLSIGGAVGGIVGALVGHGIPEDEAIAAEQYLRQGKPIVVVRAGNRVDEALKVLAAHNALNVPPAAMGAGGATEKPAA